jgi:soluble lytic murein transglycosylase-like protein
LVTVDDTSRREPEAFTFQVQDSEPEADIQVSAVVESPTEVAAPVVPPANTGMGSDVEQWRSLVTSYFGANLTDTALCLMSFESGGNPGAQNPSSGASGLMQVLPSWADTFGVTRDALFDPATNLNISRALYDDGGWGHWSPWNRGECH